MRVADESITRFKICCKLQLEVYEILGLHSVASKDLFGLEGTAHTLFNVGNTVVFIWFVKPVSKLVLWLLPERKKEKDKLFPELHSYFVESSSMSLELVNNAIVKLGNHSMKIIEKGLEVALTGNSTELRRLRKEDEIIDSGHKEILLFLQQIQSVRLSGMESKLLEKQIEAVNILETAADLITTDLVEAAEHRLENGFVASENTILKLTSLYNIAINAFRISINKFAGNEIEKQQEISKLEFKDQFQQVRSHLMQRLSETDEMRISIYRFESEVLEYIRRLHALARRLQRKAA